MLTKRGNYQPPSVEEIPDEGEPYSIIKKLPEEELLKELPEVPFEIKMIAAAPFFHVFKQKGVKLFLVSLKNVEKTLKPKQYTNPATKLPPELHEFFELFLHQETKKLSPHKPYDHKIKFRKSCHELV